MKYKCREAYRTRGHAGQLALFRLFLFTSLPSIPARLIVLLASFGPCLPPRCQALILMVLLESFCAAAFTAGSAACLVVLLLSPSRQQALTTNPNNPNLAFVVSLLLTCLLSSFALLSVKGTHACWRPSCASSPRKAKGAAAPAAAIGGGTTGRDAPAESGGGTCCPTLRSCDGDDDDAAMTTGSSDEDDLPPEDFPLERRSSFVVRYKIQQ